MCSPSSPRPATPRLGAPGAVDQVAGDAATPTAPTPAGSGGGSRADDHRRRRRPPLTEGSQPTESAPDLAGAPTELTADCTIPPKTISNESEPIDVQCLQQALQREGFYSGALTR